MNQPETARRTIFDTLGRGIAQAAPHATFAIFAFAALIFSAWLSFGTAEVIFGCDYAQIFHFYHAYLKNTVWDGQLPFWNPYTLLGKPFLADPEAAVFYPATWLWIVLPEAVAYCAALWFHFLIGGWGMRKLTREWGAPEYASTFAAAAFVVSPPVILHLQGGLLGLVFTISWWPWMMLFADRLCEKASIRDFLKLSAVLTLAFLAGQTHAFWMCGISLGLFILPRCIYGDFRSSIVRTPLVYGFLALATIFAFLLSAIEFLPLLELTTQSHRLAGKDLASSGCMNLASLTTFVRHVELGKTVLWEGAFHIGLPIVALGLLQMFKICNVRSRALLFMSAACLVVALGNNTPIFDLVYPFVPALGFFRYNIRLGMFVVFALIVASAVFWCEVEKHFAHRNSADAGNQRFVRLAFAIFAILWLADLIPNSIASGREAVRLGRFGPECRTNDFPSSIKRQFPAPPDAAPLRVFAPYTVLLGNSGMENGYSVVGCYMSLVPDRAWYYCHLAAGVNPSPYQVTFLDNSVYRKGAFPYPYKDIAVGWDAETNTILVRNPLPRAWLVRKVVPITTWPEAILPPKTLDPLVTAFVEPEFLPQTTPVTDGPIAAGAKITRFSQNNLTVDYSSDSPAILVLAEAWYPGWEAEIDGKASRVYPVNVWMRGVTVPSGVHKVAFSFRSTYLAQGAAISGLSAALWMVFWHIIRKRNPRQTPDL
jgi:hypothetical protein